MRSANFGNPEFEPTDDELKALSKEAFAEVGARHRAALARLRTEVEEMRAEVLAKWTKQAR